MDIRLSYRMQTVADMATGNAVADIGCDHGFVSIYLVEKGGFEKAIAMDLREGPLSSAREHIADHGLSDRIITRLSDGFEALEDNEADCAVIAGMGGLLMTDILKRGKRHTDNGISLVLQPQSDYDSVRGYLQEIDYEIVDEAMLIDEGKYYFVIKAMPKTKSYAGEMSEEELLYGPVLLKNKDLVLHDYLLRELSKSTELFEKLSDVQSESSKNRIADLHVEIEIIKKALDRY